MGGTGFQQGKKVIRVPEPNVVHHVVAGRPGIGERDLAIINGLILIPTRKRKRRRNNEFFLIEGEARAQLVASPSVVRVELCVVFSLKVGCDNSQTSYRNRSAVYCESSSVIRRRYREGGESGFHRGTSSNAFEHAQCG